MENKWFSKIILLLISNSFVKGIYFGTTGAVPYVVAIKDGGYYGYHLCSGVILTAEWILSHTPCLEKFNGEITIYAGTRDIRKSDETAQIRKTKDIIIEENYDRDIEIHTMALIQLDRRLRIGDTVTTIKIANLPWPSDYRHCRIHGYGLMVLTDKILNFGALHSGSVKHIEYPHNIPVRPTKCGCANIKDEQVDYFLCGITGTGGICEGDYGGPLTCLVGDDRKGERYLVAIAQTYIVCEGYNASTDYFAYKIVPCGTDGQVVDIYAYIYPHIKWIHSVLETKKKEKIPPSRSNSNIIILPVWLISIPYII